MADSPELSLVIPAFNEAGNIAPLVQEIAAALRGVDYEILLIDDGSTDGTLAEMKAVGAVHPSLRVLAHRARAGKSAGLVSGFRAARAPWVQTLDADRQNDPADVARLWGELPALLSSDARLALVAGRRKRRHDGRMKLVSSRVANSVRRAVLGDATRDTGCGLKLIRRDVALQMPYFKGLHRFLPALVKRAGYSTVEFAVEDRPRTVGVSKYGFFGRLFVGIYDLLGVIWLIRRGNRFEAKDVR